MCREVSSIKKALFSYRRAVQDLSRGVHSEGSFMDRASCREAIEQTKGFSMERSSYRGVSRMREKATEESR